MTRSTSEAPVLLGTVAIEPNRWTRDVEASSILAVSKWFDVVADAGFDGVELWERHATSASSEEHSKSMASKASRRPDWATTSPVR